MPDKKTLTSVTFTMRDGNTIIVNAPHAEAALNAFVTADKEAAGSFIRINDTNGYRYINRDCICSVTPDAWNVDFVPPLPCNDPGCPADYVAPGGGSTEE